jgi:hypothetical protein
MAKSKELFSAADEQVQALVTKVLELVRKNRRGRGAATETEIVREVKEIVS